MTKHGPSLVMQQLLCYVTFAYTQYQWRFNIGKLCKHRFLGGKNMEDKQSIGDFPASSQQAIFDCQRVDLISISFERWPISPDCQAKLDAKTDIANWNDMSLADLGMWYQSYPQNHHEK